MTDRLGAFLDRDGVLNAAIVDRGQPRPPASVDELELLPGAVGACNRLRAGGYVLVLVTNQPDIARGRQRVDVVDMMNAEVARRCGIDAIEVCLHDDGDGCLCRKPLPGMLITAARRLGISLSASVTVGDRWKDVAAGRAAGTATVFVDHGYDEPRPAAPDLVVSCLADAVPWILDSRQRNERPISRPSLRK